MHSPNDVVKGRVVDYNPRTSELTIKACYPNWPIMLKREYKHCLVQPVDSRALSDKQRRTCFALLRAISDYTGQGLDSTKEYMKIRFLTEDMEQTADRIFSLSNAPMSVVCAYQRYLVRFILDFDIPCDIPLLNFVDDVADFIYYSLVTKHCCICGMPTDLHHIDRVGMGRDRNDIIHEGMEVLPLCREHHTEAHTMPDAEFFEKYHIPGGVVMDKTLCRLYGVKARKKA